MSLPDAPVHATMPCMKTFLPYATFVIVGILGCETSSDDAPGGSSPVGSGGSADVGGAAAQGGTEPEGGAAANGGAGGSLAGGGSASGGSGGQDDGAGGHDPACAGFEYIKPSNGTVTDAGGNGDWSPGEEATVSVTLTNEGPDGFYFYPGATFESDNAYVVSANPEWNDAFGINANQSITAEAVFTADSSLTAGTVVTFTVTANTLSGGCPGAQSIEFNATLE